MMFLHRCAWGNDPVPRGAHPAALLYLFISKKNGATFLLPKLAATKTANPCFKSSSTLVGRNPNLEQPLEFALLSRFGANNGERRLKYALGGIRLSNSGIPPSARLY